MISIEESQKLMTTFIQLRDTYNETQSKKDKLAFEKQQKICVEKFKYLITMKTNLYKKFSNYEDLNQDGYEALLKAMKNYNPDKGIFFYWAFKYINTRISRCANLHTAIRYPLKYSKKNIPHKESVMPLLIEKFNCPEMQLENMQVKSKIEKVFSILPENQIEIVKLVFGFDSKPIPISKVCEQLNVSRIICLKNLSQALSTIKDNIKI